MNQYDNSSIGNASYDQPDYSDFGNSDTGDYSNSDNALKKKLIIVPGIMMKLGVFFIRFIPTKLLLRITYNIQKKKKKY